MQVDSALAHPHRVSPATWCALAAVVLLLTSLTVSLVGCFIAPPEPGFPNYYTCRVTCTSGFGIGSNVEYTNGGPVNSSPGGALVGQENAGSMGAIVAGPGSPQGSNEVWWQVTFADNLTGWIAEANLTVTGGTNVVVQQKDLDVCVPVQWNKNRPEFDPNVVQDVNGDCETR